MGGGVEGPPAAGLAAEAVVSALVAEGPQHHQQRTDLLVAAAAQVRKALQISGLKLQGHACAILSRMRYELVFSFQMDHCMATCPFYPTVVSLGHTLPEFRPYIRSGELSKRGDTSDYPAVKVQPL